MLGVPSVRTICVLVHICFELGLQRAFLAARHSQQQHAWHTVVLGFKFKTHTLSHPLRLWTVVCPFGCFTLQPCTVSHTVSLFLLRCDVNRWNWHRFQTNIFPFRQLKQAAASLVVASHVGSAKCQNTMIHGFGWWLILHDALGVVDEDGWRLQLVVCRMKTSPSYKPAITQAVMHVV